MSYDEAKNVWETFKRVPGISKSRASRICDLPASLVGRIIDKLLGKGLLEHKWAGYDRYYAIGDFDLDYEFEEEE